MSVKRALKWSFLSELASKAIQPLVFIVLARLLTPEDFGVMTAAIMVVAFSQIFWEAGMGKALIQRQTDIEEATNAAFCINIVLGTAIASLLYLFSQLIAQALFQDERVTAVLKVMTLQILFGALSSVHTAQLQKEMNFRKLFWVRFTTVSLPGFASLPLAWNGMGYWALVAGVLTGQIAQTIMLWQLSPWRPSFKVNFKVTKEIGRFGAWVGLTGLLSWFYLWADALVVSYFLGGRNLGLYRIAQQFSDLLYLLLFSPLLPVAYSHFSRISDDFKRVQQITNSAIVLITWVALPLALFIFVFSQNIESALFGEKWIGLGTVMAYLSLRQGFAWITSLNGEIYRAMGKPQLETIVLLVSLLVYVPVYIITAQSDLVAFAQGRLVLVILSMVGHMWLLSKIMRISLRSIYKKECFVLLFGFSVAWILHRSLGVLSGHDLLTIAVGFPVFSLIILCVFYFFGQQKYIYRVSGEQNIFNLRRRLSF